jgi:hypothetical protein
MLLTDADIVRPVLFARAWTRVLTDKSNARIVGELVSLFALVSIAGREHHPWSSILGIVCAFVLPDVVLQERALERVRGALRLDNGRGHIVAGTIGVFLCLVLYEILLNFVVYFDRGFSASLMEEEAEEDEL